MTGIMRLFDAIWTLRDHGVLRENLEGAIFGHSLKTYVRVYLVVANILMPSANAVVNGSQVARWVEIVAGSNAAISKAFRMPFYPVWSLVSTGLGVAVICGLTVCGSRATDRVM
jgi:hypothetical protein